MRQCPLIYPGEAGHNFLFPYYSHPFFCTFTLGKHATFLHIILLYDFVKQIHKLQTNFKLLNHER